MYRKLPIILLFLFLLSQTAGAQNSNARKDTRKGNREYKAKHFDRAEVDYRRALHHDSTAYRAHYNLGNTLYRQKKYEEAAQHYSRALEHPDLDKKTRSRILHNRGNSNLKEGLQKENRAEGMQQFQQAVNDYQEALKINPKNDDTRYNLSYAKKLLQQAQQQQQQNGGGGQNDQDKKDNKDKNKDGNNGQDKQQDQNNQQNDQQNQQQKTGPSTTETAATTARAEEAGCRTPARSCKKQREEHYEGKCQEAGSSSRRQNRKRLVTT